MSEPKFTPDHKSGTSSLIAAAPKLYAALDRLLGAAQRYDHDPNSSLVVARYMDAKIAARAALDAARPKQED